MVVPVLGVGIGSAATGLDMTVLDVPRIGEGEEPTAWADAPGLAAVTVDMVTNANTGQQLRAAVFTPDGTLIAHLPRRRGLQGMVEHNAPGTGALSVLQYDDVLEENPTLWDDRNIVRIYLGGKAIQAWVMEGWSVETDHSGNRTLNRTGRGNLSLLDTAVLYPEKTLNRLTSDDRYFNLGSVVGDWYVAKEWKRPKGVRHKKSHRDPLPKKFPFKKAQWLWATSPEKRSKMEANYFRATLTLEEKTPIRLWAVGDDSLLLYLNGELVLRHSKGGWRKTKSYTVTLPAGDHIIAAMVHNADTGGNDRMGFLFGAAEVDKKGRIVSRLLVSKPTKWRVRRPLSQPPGWFPSQVLAAFIEEAQDRGVAGFDGITLGYHRKRDSAGRPWRKRIAQSYKIGTRGLDLLTQLTERGLDVEMTPDGEVRLWRDRGRDLSRFIALDGWTAAGARGASSGIVTEALVKYKQGWTDYSAPALQERYGRRETTLSAGGGVERREARAQARAAFDEYGEPEETYDLTTSSLRGPQPFYDYRLFDVVTAPMGTTRGPVRVLSIAWTETESGDVEWTHQMYPV